MAPSTIAIIILALTAIAFAVPRIPIAVTAILASLAMVIAGILEPSEALGMFGHDTVIMIAGTSVLATAIFETGLAGRVGRGIMRWRWAVKSEANFMLVMFLVTATLSTVMGNVAVLAIMYPIASSVISESGLIRRRSLYMSMAIASCLGGNVTLAGSSMNMLAQGILETTEGVEAMGFFTLTRGALPSIAISLAYFMTVGRKLQERVFSSGDGEADSEGGHRPFIRDKAIITACCFVLCIAGFIAGVWTIGMTALLAATICILTGCVSFKAAMRDMDWTTVCVLAGALGFAKGVNDSGAGQVLAEYGLSLLGGQDASPRVVVFMLVLIGGIITNVMQNNAVVAIMLPIAITMAQTMGVDAMPMAVAVVFGASFAFATPIGTAPMTMSLAAGYRFSDYIKVGGLCNILVIVVTGLCIPLLYSF